MSVKSALALYNECRGRQRTISFGCPVLDQHIGPIMNQGVTEVAGEAGCGKTQLCMVLALQALIQSDLKGSVAIMSCGEGAYPIKRLSDLAVQYEALYPPFTARAFLEKVHIVECRNQEHAVESINKTVPDMCRQLNVRLLVIDSMAGLVRFEYDVTQEAQMKDRTVFLFNFARQLKWISDIHHIAILVVNQVTASGFDSSSSHVESIPALGLVWSTCVTTRLLLSKSKAVRNASLSIGIPDADEFAVGDDTTLMSIDPHVNDISTSSNLHVPHSHSSVITTTRPTRRSMRIEFSPYCPVRSVDFEIRNDGIRGILL